MNGDTLTILNYSGMIAFHKKNQAMVTIATHRRKVTIDFGVLEINNGSQELRGYLKPTYEHPVSMGIYLFEPTVLRYLEKGKRLDLPELVWKLLDAKEKVLCFPSADY